MVADAGWSPTPDGTSTVTLVLLGTLATDAVNWPTVMFSEDSPTSPSTMASLTVNCLGAAGGGGGEGLGGSGDGGGGDRMSSVVGVIDD